MSDGLELLTLMQASSARSSAAAANRNAEAANRNAEAAKEASEERLEMSSGVKFITINDYELDREVIRTFLGFATETKERIKPAKSYSIKSTDISHLEENKDDYGNIYTTVYLEDRCNLDFENLLVLGDLKTVTKNIQNQIQGVK